MNPAEPTPTNTRSSVFASWLALAATALFGSIACQIGPASGWGRAARRATVVVDPPMVAGSATAFEAAMRVTLPVTEPEDHPALHNVYALSDNIISGGEPENVEAFRILAEKGIRTILSVDGKVPDAERAAQHGMKYVHVPIQYKGITDDEVAKIAKTFREQEGPFYVHCFHGQHRGPAAAAIGRLALDGVVREEALAEMRQWCGTSSSYEGLYATVAFGDVPTADETRAMDWDFPEADPLEGVAGAMVQISRSYDAIKAAKKNDWKPNPDHPDLSALNEAAKLAELFERTHALGEVASEPADFRDWMQASTQQSGELHEAIRAMKAGAGTHADAAAAFQQLASTCKACHNAYRN